MSGSGGEPRPLLSAAIVTALSLAILISLGMWQLQRLRWKSSLIVRIDAAEHAPPVPLADSTPPLFTRVEVRGTLRPDHVALYGAEVRGMHMGAQAVQLLDRPGQKPVLVVLGWVPTDAGPPKPSAGAADITGYVRLPEESSWLSATDDLEGRHFYALNPTSIGAALGAADAAPFTLVALGGAAAPGQPEPSTTLPRPTNNHLQYAFTWFGLAGALAVVFGSWAFKKR